MKKKMLMKQEIARNLKELCETESLEAIRVSGLCARCGISRGTFYYHFIDLYDLMGWIFETELAGPAEARIRAGEQAGLSEFCLNILLNSRSFYRKALKQSGQNSLFEAMLKRSADCWRLFLGQRLAASGKVLEAGHELLIGFASQVVCGVVMDWVQKDMETPVSELLQLEEAVIWGIYNKLDIRE